METHRMYFKIWKQAGETTAAFFIRPLVSCEGIPRTEGLVLERELKLTHRGRVNHFKQ